MTAERHEMALEQRVATRRGRPDCSYRGTCSCGWQSDWVAAAGLVHGAHGAHVDAEAGR